MYLNFIQINPKVSIIIPNYNHAVFLQQRLDSVFKQTFQDIEVILLDDASTDGSQNILLKYKNHPKVAEVHINTENSGSPFKQWEKGIELAKGTYIWIAESDDFAETCFLEELLSKMSTEIVLAYSASIIVSEDSVMIKKDDWAQKMDLRKWSSNYLIEGKLEILNYLRYRNIISNASSVIFRKDSVRGIERATSMSYCGDWYIWLQTIKNGKICYVNKPLNYFRKHASSTRSFKELKREEDRFAEYFFIIRTSTSFRERFLNRKKYDWILKELREKEIHIKNLSFLKIKMPIALIYRYLELKF